MSLLIWGYIMQRGGDFWRDTEVNGMDEALLHDSKKACSLLSRRQRDMDVVIKRAKHRRTWLPLLGGILSLIFLVARVSLVAADTGTINTDISSGPVGTLVSVSGSGFSANTTYTTRFASSIVSTGTMSGSGQCVSQFAVPASPRGQYPITVTTSSDNSNMVNFMVTPKITLSSTSGRSGSQVQVSGSGFQANSSVTVLFDSTVAIHVLANISGSFPNSAITVPAVSEGEHVITGSDAAGSAPGIVFNVTEPMISLSKTSGHIAEQLQVNGSGFQGNYSVSIVFDSTTVGTIVTDSTGSFSSATVSIPPGTEGEHNVTVKDAVSASQGITFRIKKPEITADLSSGQAGDSVLISGLGFKPGSAVTILFDSTAIGNIMADATGRFSNVAITIPSASGGKHTIVGKDTINTSSSITFDSKQGMNLSPTSGAMGDKLTVSGNGFAKNSTVVIDLDGTTLASNGKTDANGAFSFNINVPAAPGGDHIIRSRDTSGNQNTATFNVMQKLAISPTTGPPLTTTAISGTGFSADKPVTIRYNGNLLDISPPVTTDSRGNFNASFEVPATLPGSYNIEASDSIYTASTSFVAGLSAELSQPTTESSPGYIGMKLTVSGTGFKPNAKITVARATIQEVFAQINADTYGIFSVTFNVPPSPAGKHTIIVTDGVNTKELDFFIESQSPEVPRLSQPDTETKAKQPVFFDWDDVSDISGVNYMLQVATDENFTLVVLQKDELSESNYTVTEDDELEPVTKKTPYYWRVKAVDLASNESEWSDVRSFSVGFILTLPNGESELTLSAWAVYGISGFIVLIFISFFMLGKKKSPFH